MRTRVGGRGRLRRWIRGLSIAVTAVLLAGLTGTSAGAATTKAGPPLRVELWGDSLSAQSSTYFAYFLAVTRKVTAREHVFGGTALCDWIPDITREIDPRNKSGFHPQVAVLQFFGNSYTGCMRTKDGRALSGQALVDKYADGRRGGDRAIRHGEDHGLLRRRTTVGDSVEALHEPVTARSDVLPTPGTIPRQPRRALQRRGDPAGTGMANSPRRCRACRGSAARAAGLMAPGRSWCANLMASTSAPSPKRRSWVCCRPAPYPRREPSASRSPWLVRWRTISACDPPMPGAALKASTAQTSRCPAESSPSSVEHTMRCFVPSMTGETQRAGSRAAWASGGHSREILRASRRTRCGWSLDWNPDAMTLSNQRALIESRTRRPRFPEARPMRPA